MMRNFDWYVAASLHAISARGIRSTSLRRRLPLFVRGKSDTCSLQEPTWHPRTPLGLHWYVGDVIPPFATRHRFLV